MSIVLLAFFAMAANAMPAVAARLSLEDALRRAIAADFALPAEEARMIAAAAGIRQADRRVNPSVGVDVENFAGSGAFKGFNRNETTLFLQQLIEFGGKRAARVGVAQAEADATRARAAVRVLDLLRDVQVAWIEALAATAQVRIVEERLSIARQLQAEISRRSQAGRDPAFAESRANAQLALEQIALERAQSGARTARAVLSSYWRGSPSFDLDLHAFEHTRAGADPVVRSADVALIEAERETAYARIGLERSRAAQDPTVRLGLRHLAENNDVAIVAGVSIPLGIFDTNRDNIDRAYSERTAAELDLEAARRNLERETARLEGRRAANATEARRIQAEVLPQARRAVKLIQDGVERGGFNYTDFSEAQRALNEVELRRVEALKAYHLEDAALARLTGRHTKLQGVRKKPR
jgi:cobalt-zinc-cadmium efflux system outer membrane protein